MFGFFGQPVFCISTLTLLIMFDIVIISVPGIVSRLPQAAPALLKASIESAGFSCRTMDFNIRIYQDSVNLDHLENYFTSGLDKDQQVIAEKLVETWSKEILSVDPKWVGISVFTYQNRIATELFCKCLKKLAPTIKIILGGQGLSDGGIEGPSGFGRRMVAQGLANFWIRSEGEKSLVELLKGNIDYPGINSDSFEQIDDLDSVAFPNYDDYDLDLYQPRSLPITGSRGCVRACSFCDIHEHWKFRYRSGQSIADEIQQANKKYDITQFNFTDSLINGNLKEFNKFINQLADYNDTVDKKITWSGQFIVRSAKEVNETYWRNIARSGGKELGIGVETGSDQVRMHMNKRFSNQDLDYTMNMLEKYNITCVFLIIVGYPTETDQDFQQTLDMFDRYKSLAPKIITDVNIGSTLGILPGTPLYKHANELLIEIDDYENNWIALDNPDLTLEKRLQRRSVLKNYLLEKGYQLKFDSTEHMLKLLEQNKDKFEKRLQIRKKIKFKKYSLVKS